MCDIGNMVVMAMACNGRHSWLEYAYMSKHVKTKHLVDLHSFSCFFELMTRIVATDENWWRLWWRLMVGSRRKLARHIIHYNTIKWHNMKKDDAILINSDQRKFRSQTSDLWTDAATREESEGRQKRRSHRRERARREKIKVREKVEKVAKHCVFSNVLRTPKVEK